MIGNKLGNRFIIKSAMRLAGLVVLFMIGLAIHAPKAMAAPCNDVASLPPDTYGIASVVRADIYDEAGNFLRHSNDFTFKVTTVDAFGYGYNQAQLDAGIAQWPSGRGGADYRFFTKDFAVNAAQGDNCADSGGPGRRFIFHSEVGTAGYLLDCLWDARNNGTVTHRYDLLNVNDSYGDPWIGTQTQTPGIVRAGFDMNDQPTILIIFKFIERPHGTIQGYKVDRATLKDGTGPYKNNTITASSGPRPAANASQPYHLNLLPGAYSLTSSANPGWRLVGYTYNSSYYDLGTGPFGNLSSVNIAAGETKDIWFVYDRYYYPWLQSLNGDVVANGNITGQKIGMAGSRNASATDKEASYLVIISAVGKSGSDFCSTNAYSIGDAGVNCNPRTYSVNNKYMDYLSVASGVEQLWNKNGAGSGGTCSTGMSEYLTGNLSSAGINLNHPSSNDLSSGCQNGKIWKATGDYRLGGKNFDTGRATYYVKGDLSLTGNIIANHKSSYSDPRQVPNLGIIVDGDITIDPSVTEIDASIFATGKIYTCHPAGTAIGAIAYYKGNGPSCKNSLSVNGMMGAVNGFTLGRTYITSFNGAPGNPAEKLAASGQAMVFPPPGFGDDSSVTIQNFKYLGEGAPQF